MKNVFIFFVVWLCAAMAAAGELSMQVASKQVAFGQTFNLNISYDGDDGNMLQPDLTPLQNDFTVYSTSASMQSRYINGRNEQRRDWVISLMPKKMGKMTIPAIKVGQYETKPVTIDVVDAADVQISDRTAQQGGEKPQMTVSQFAVSLEVENKTPFVQQEINAVLTIEDQQGLDLTAEPSFEETSDWVIKVLDKPEVIDQNGKRLIKFFYALFPQKSGQLEVPSVHVDGVYTSFENTPQSMPNNSGFFKMFDFDLTQMFGVQKPVHLVTKPKMIYVKPIPSENKHYWWLPADALHLTARWSDDRPVFKVGEAVSREVILTAIGVADTQLPDLILPESESIKQYPEKPQLSTTSRNNQIVSQAVIRVVYIPQKAGRQVIPEIVVPWYNVKTQQMEFARIPAEDMVIGTEAVQSEAPAEKNDTFKSLPKTDSSASQQAAKPVQPASERKTEWYWLIAAFFAGILVNMWFHRRNSSVSHKTSAYMKKIENNLRQRDYRALRDNLLAWGQKTYTDSAVRHLNDLANVVGDEEFAAQMETLNSILYAGNTAILDKDVILRCLKKHKDQKSKTKREKPLPDLYK